jgi:hypothetical protein
MAQQKPEIVYKTVIINKNNVDKVLAARHGGYYNVKTNGIVLFKYIMADDVPLSKRAAVLFFINQVKEYGDKIIFHEMHHWQNGDFCFANYYQDNYADCLNEISAITAELVYTDPKYKLYGVKQVMVACSMMNAAYIFLHYKFDKYMTRFISGILQANKTGTDKVQIAQLQKWQNMYKNNPDTLFDKDFYKITKSYFTYNGYCIFEDKIYEYAKDVWNDANKNINQIKQKCMDKTYQMIDNLIPMSNTHQK